MEDYFEKLSKLYEGITEFHVRTLLCGVNVKVATLDSMCADDKVSNYCVKPLLELSDASCLADVAKKLTFGATVKQENTFQTLVGDFTNGFALVFVEDENGAVAVDCRTTVGRSVAEPPTSMVMRGPREGFVENLKTNMSLLRKRLKTPNFKTINLTVGKYTNTSVAVCFLDGVADSALVADVQQKLTNISIDGILDSSYLANYLDADNTTLFHRVGMTEKPDVAVGKLLEGRVAIVVDGSPMVLTLPYLYVEDLQSPGDYYDNAVLTSVSRVLRFVSVVASLLLPALYVCFQMYNYQIIPLNFLVTMLGATQNIPFRPMFEMVLIIVIFDILREANLRMPSAVGISLSLVGAIVLGDAAVKAGLFGAPAVMIGALSGIGLFAMPENTLVLSCLRLVITVISGIAGIFGVILSMLTVLLYMTSLNNFGAPFLAPFAPNIPHDKQDAVLQKPLQQMKERPESFKTNNKKRR